MAKHSSLTNGSIPKPDVESLEMKCDVCDKKFNGPSAFEVHMEGSKHKRRVELLKQKEQENSKEQEDDDVPDSIYCTLCKVYCSGYIPYQLHLKSGKHIKQLERENLKKSLKNAKEVLPEKEKHDDDDDELELFGKCETCSKVFYDPGALDKHLKCSGHKKKLNQVKLKSSISENFGNDSTVVISKEDEESDDESSYAICKSCNKKFSGPESFKLHLESNLHKRRAKAKKQEEELLKTPEGAEMLKDGKYHCKDCEKEFDNFMSYKSHLKANLHLKKNEKKSIADSLENHPEITVMYLDEAGSDEEEKEYYVCKLCRRSFTGPENAKEHVAGKKHRKAKEIKRRLKMIAEGENYKETPSQSEKTDANKMDEKDLKVKKDPRKDSVDDDDFEVISKD